MGDRAYVQLKDRSGEYSQLLYLHWGGDTVPALLAKACEIMKGRPNDLEYGFARLVGAACEEHPGNLSVGVQPCPGECLFSPGDAGTFIVDISDDIWKVTQRAGYPPEDGYLDQPGLTWVGVALPDDDD